MVVTGLGLISPLGACVKDAWRRLCLGESAIASTSKLAAEFETLNSRVAAWIDGHTLHEFIESVDLCPLIGDLWI